MSNLKLVKVDNWGIYFLQRLKNFFNRTDYCDLTLQFQDKAQLKVHRLVLSACTEYFEVLERTCEMYEDCLVMPDDLQADVVVPIINFMYTGQLEFSTELLERLYQTSQIMNMPILTKLLNSHRQSLQAKASQQINDFVPKRYAKHNDKHKIRRQVSTSVVPVNNKRSYTKAFNKSTIPEEKIIYKPSKSNINSNDIYFCDPSPVNPQNLPKKAARYDPRPTRYELPEELESDSTFDNSFSSISYTSQPLMVHPETVKRYSNKFNDPSTSKRLGKDIDCKKIASNDNIYDDGLSESINDTDIFSSSYMASKERPKDRNQLFDQIVEQNEGPKVTIDESNSKIASNLDHAKIISQVLKKYPHLVKSNKNIKLKILNTPKMKKEPQFEDVSKSLKIKTEKPNEDFTYESDVIDSKQAAKLIVMGAENIKGPWICLICGTPGKALHFTSYYKFRRHLVNVHNEKPVPNICEYCGLKSLKRNYMLHHLYSQHGVPPPAQYKFPKCNQCNYIALTEGFLVRHKLVHKEPRRFQCNVCVKTYSTSQDLLSHIQSTGHKFTPEKKANLQCVYCQKVFLRDYNLYAHLKSNHKQEAMEDEIIEDSDEEKLEEQPEKKVRRDNKITLKYDTTVNPQSKYELQYEIQENLEGSIEIVSKNQNPVSPQKILNPGFTSQTAAPIDVDEPQISNVSESYNETEEIVMIDNIEYIVKNDELVPRKEKNSTKDFIVSDMLVSDTDQAIDSVIPTSSLKFTNINKPHLEENPQSQTVIINKQANINHPIQIVVSNEEEYKALISANHPIIFENSDVNKTLAVLTTSSSVNTTTMSMNNTASNDMMIIPGNYPMTVSDTVPANNSNIVVVYSHPVESQSKQYQLVTSSQGLQSQFIQSPAIITQSYEAVSPSTTVIGTHVLDTTENWQNTMHENMAKDEQQTTFSNVQTIQHSVDVEMRTTIDENEPQLDLTQQTAEEMVAPFTVEDVETLDNSNQDTINICETTDHGVINEAQATDEMELDQTAQHEINIQTKNLNVIEPEPIIEIENSSETPVTAVQSEPDIENVSNVEHIEETEQAIENTLLVTNHEENLSTSTTEQPIDVLVEKELEPVQEVTYVPSPTYTQEQQPNIEDPVIDSNSESTNIALEKIETPTVNSTNLKSELKNVENITSEWSEDEYDVATDNGNDVSQIHVENHVKNVITNETPVEIEETIENIQQEVNSTFVSSPAVEVDSKINMQMENIKTVDNNKIAEKLDEPQNKISSLLNEWDDNDSQEEVTSVNKPDDNIENEPLNNNNTDKPEKCASANSEIIAENESQEVKAPDDKIKSLVSDWDDDDE